MEQLVVYGIPQWFEDETQPQVRFGEAPSPQIKEIASRLQDGGLGLGDGTLCDACAKLNLDRSIFNAKATSDDIAAHGQDEDIMALGRLREVKERDCALCQLALQVLDAEYKLHNDGKSIDLDGNAEAIVTLYWRSHEDFLEVKDNHDLWRMGVKLEIALPEGRGTFKTKLMIEPFASPQIPELLLGRAYGEKQIDIDLIQTWTRCCEEWHGKGCKSSFRTKLSHPAAVFLMYGIDVNDMHLKRMAEGDKYCALSYVWGKKFMYLLKKDNLEKFMSANGIAEIIGELPRTIVDAIKLVRDLRVPFLWVDSVCIPQDDDEYKAEAIGKMHLVYSKAEFTIVAASGPDSFYGLPGYGGNPRDVPQPVRRVGKDGLVLGVRPRYQWSLAQSPHGFRGWTYQEMCFSTRSLVFMNGTVYFQCQQALWREDWALEHPGVRFFLHEMDNRFMEETEVLGQYRHSLREYTRRKLTYQTDAVNAYTGILEAQRLIFGGMPLGPVCAGLHMGLIDWVILFYLHRGSKRREGLPTWSWAGWIGEVFAPFPMFGSIQRLIKWEHEHCPAAMTHFEKLDFLGLPDMKHALRVRTLSAMMLLDPDIIDGPGFIHPLWALLDSRGHTCGFVSLHDCDFWDSFPEPRLLLLVEVVVLSDKMPGQGFYPSRSSKVAYDPDSVAEDGTPRPRMWQVEPFTGWEGKVREEFDKDPLDQYNVLILLPRAVEADGKKLTGFHEKIGVGVLHNQALSWAVREPNHKEFWIL